MIYIRPLTDRWEASRAGLDELIPPVSNFIWRDYKGPWDTSRVSRAMAERSQYYIGIRITLQDWRYIAIVISKKHARDRGALRADFPDEGNDNEEQYEVPDDLAAGHTSRTAANYGVTVDILK